MIPRAELLERLEEAESRVKFTPGNHTYRLDGKHVPGVTTILKCWHKEFLVRWMVRVQQEADIAAAYRHWDRLMKASDQAEFTSLFLQFAGDEYEHQKQSREAADIGKQMHALMEHYFKTQLGLPTEAPHVSDEAESLFSSVLEFLKGGDLEPLTMERRVFNVPLWYAGTSDLFALYQGLPVIVDYKSRKNEGEHLWPEQRCQSAAYRSAAQSMGLGEWGGLILTVPKDGGKVNPVPVNSSIADDMDAFMACRSLWAYGKPRKVQDKAA